MLHVAEAFIDNNYHPTVICRGSIFLHFVLVISLLGQKLSVSDECLVLVIVAYNKALEDAIAVLEKIAMTVDVKDRKFLFHFLQKYPKIL